MKNFKKLEVGRTYLNGKGEEVKIIEFNIHEPTPYKYVDADGVIYTEDGLYMISQKSSYDLIALLPVDSVSVTEPTEGAKKNAKKDGKASRRFIHPSSLDQMQFAMDAGEIKYGAYNFMKGHERSALISAAMRHLEKMMWGEWIDEDCTKILGREVTHLGCVLANMNMLAAQIAEGTSRDDTRKKENK